MAKTNFINGITTVTAAFLNKIFNHVHDGADDDGSATKVDAFQHVNWGDNGGFTKSVDTTGLYEVEFKDLTGTPSKAVLTLPTLFMRAKIVLGSYGKGSELSANNVTKIKAKLLFSGAGGLSVFAGTSYNVLNAVIAPAGDIQVNSEDYVADTMTAHVDCSYPAISPNLSYRYEAMIKKIEDKKITILVHEIASNGTATILSPGTPPQQDIYIHISAV